MTPPTSATKIRPSDANWMDVGSDRPLMTTESRKAPGTTDAVATASDGGASPEPGVDLGGGAPVPDSAVVRIKTSSPVNQRSWRRRRTLTPGEVGRAARAG